MTQKPKEYKWLSKSSKRRIRTGVQKQKHKRKLECGERKHTVFIQFQQTGYIHLKYEHLHHDGELKALAQRRLRILKATDPFSGCRGVWHRFSCGHQFKVLCALCAEAWDSGKHPFCKLTASAHLSRDIEETVGWPIRCSSCEGIFQSNPSWKAKNGPVGESYEKNFPKEFMGEFVPEYLDEEGLRSTLAFSFYRIPRWNRWRLPKLNEGFSKQHSHKDIDTEEHARS